MSTEKTPFEQWRDDVWQALLNGKMKIADFHHTLIDVSERGEPAYKLCFADEGMIVRVNKNGSYTWIS